MKDFFISRNSADREWAEWIAGELEKTGYTTTIQDWDFRPGGNFVLDMHDAVKDCERTLIVLSQNFLDAEYTQSEWAAAFAQDPQGKKRKLVPVRVRVCEPDGLLRSITFVDLVGQDNEAQAREILIRGVQKRRANRKGQFPPSPRPKSAFPGLPIFHVPLARNPFFTGREKILQELHQRLQSKGGAALSQVQAISGLGGIGKTQTALEYSYRNRDKYQAVLWTRAESEESLTSALAEIADVLNLAEKDSPEQSQAIEAVRRWLGERTNWLLILDNADHPEMVKGFLPTDHNGCVLVTSRADVFDSIGIAQPLRMRTMPLQEAHQFLYKRTGRPVKRGKEAKAVQDLARELGYLPLALEQAAAYIVRVRCTFQIYLDSFRIRGMKLLDRQGPIAGDHQESVRTTWSMNIEQVAQQSEASVELLKLSAFLAPEEIPLELLVKGSKRIGPGFSAQVSEQDLLSIEEVLQPLTQYSLIRREPGSGSYGIHRMVQAVVQASMGEEERRQWATRTVVAVHQAFPNIKFHNWEFCEILTPHAQCCLELVKTFGLETPEAGHLLNQLGEYLRERGRYRTAQPAHERALAIREKALHPEHPDVATSLNNLAFLYMTQGEFSRALPLLDRALAIREKALGSKHPDVASSLNYLALLYHDLGDYSRAMPLHKQALAIREKALHLEHPDVANSLNNLALLYKSQNNFTRALSLYKRALAISEKKLGSEHPDVATTLNNMALAYEYLGDFSHALTLHKRALAIREKALGSEHPHVANSLNNLALLYKSQGDYNHALTLHDQALAILEKAVGPKHPDVANSLHNLASLYKSQGDYSSALDLYQRSLAIWEDVLPGHPNLATGLENYASLLDELGRQDEAKNFKASAKRIRDEHARENPQNED